MYNEHKDKVVDILGFDFDMSDPIRDIGKLIKKLLIEYYELKEGSPEYSRQYDSLKGILGKVQDKELLKNPLLAVKRYYSFV